MKKVQLNLADKQLIIRVINNLKEPNKCAATARSIRESFELKEAAKDIEKMNEKREEERLKAIDQSIEEKVKFQKAIEKSENYTRKKIVIPERLGWDELTETGKHSHTIDDGILSTLIEFYDKTEWNKEFGANEQGRLEIVDTPVNIAMQEAIANLGDALRTAEDLSENKPQKTKE